MWRWLRSLLGSAQEERERAEAGGEPGQKPEAESRLSAEPLIVRGAPYYNTSEVERPLSQDPEPTDARDVEGLARTLLHASRIEDRRAAAEALSDLGHVAAAAIPALLRSLAAQDRALREAALEALDAIEPNSQGHAAVQEVMGSGARHCAGENCR